MKPKIGYLITLDEIFNFNETDSYLIEDKYAYTPNITIGETYDMRQLNRPALYVHSSPQDALTYLNKNTKYHARQYQYDSRNHPNVYEYYHIFAVEILEQKPVRKPVHYDLKDDVMCASKFKVLHEIDYATLYQDNPSNELAEQLYVVSQKEVTDENKTLLNQVFQVKPQLLIQTGIPEYMSQVLDFFETPTFKNPKNQFDRFSQETQSAILQTIVRFVSEDYIKEVFHRIQQNTNQPNMSQYPYLMPLLARRGFNDLLHQSFYNYQIYPSDNCNDISRICRIIRNANKELLDLYVNHILVSVKQRSESILRSLISRGYLDIIDKLYPIINNAPDTPYDNTKWKLLCSIAKFGIPKYQLQLVQHANPNVVNHVIYNLQKPQSLLDSSQQMTPITKKEMEQCIETVLNRKNVESFVLFSILQLGIKKYQERILANPKKYKLHKYDLPRSFHYLHPSVLNTLAKSSNRNIRFDVLRFNVKRFMKQMRYDSYVQIRAQIAEYCPQTWLRDYLTDVSPEVRLVALRRSNLSKQRLIKLMQTEPDERVRHLACDRYYCLMNNIS